MHFICQFLFYSTHVDYSVEFNNPIEHLQLEPNWNLFPDF
jgi:hypothetical protein